MAAGERDGIAWLRAHLLGDDRLLRPSPGAGDDHRRAHRRRLARLPAWPPPGTGERRCTSTPATSLRDDRRPRARRRQPTATAMTRPTRRRRSAARCCSTLGRSSTTRRSRPATTCSTYTTAPLPRDRGGDRPRLRRAVGARQPALFRSLRPALRCRRRGVSRNVCDALVERRSGRASRTPMAAGTSLSAVADRPPVRRRPSHPPAGLLRRSPALRAQPGDGTAPRRPPPATMQAVEIEILRGAGHPSALVLPTVH